MSMGGLMPIIEAAVARMRAIVPGKVSRVSRASGREMDVDFDAGLGRRIAGVETGDGTQPAAPVLFPAGGGFSMVWPLNTGDEGLGLAADRNIERWRQDRAVGHAHSDGRTHDLSDVLILPVSITLPASAPDSPGDDWVVSGPEGEAIRIGGADGKLTLTKAGVVVATLTMESDGEMNLTPAPGKTVNVGGNASPLALHDPLIIAMDTFIAALVAAGAGPAYAGAAGAQAAWNGVKSTIAALNGRGT